MRVVPRCQLTQEAEHRLAHTGLHTVRVVFRVSLALVYVSNGSVQQQQQQQQQYPATRDDCCGDCVNSGGGNAHRTAREPND